MLKDYYSKSESKWYVEGYINGVLICKTACIDLVVAYRLARKIYDLELKKLQVK